MDGTQSPAVSGWEGRKNLLLILFLLLPAAVLAAGEYADQRRAMLQLIEQEVLLTAEYIGTERLTPAVAGAMGSVPRHAFVPRYQRRYAYENRPLDIGFGQTISQPYIVALMTELAQLQPGDKVLEVGTGSGYQAAVLAQLTDQVFTIEIIEPLGRRAAERFREQGYDSIQARIGDGYYGWQEASPFDVILVTAAADHIPPPLIRQLQPGGRMVIPVGGRFQVQQLLVVEKDEEGKVRTRQILPVRFVPLTGDH
jgi:protein-L-isoaspartate(D-aspartate) O-methyltransferase